MARATIDDPVPEHEDLDSQSLRPLPRAEHLSEADRALPEGVLRLVLERRAEERAARRRMRRARVRRLVRATVEGALVLALVNAIFYGREAEFVAGSAAVGALAGFVAHLARAGEFTTQPLVLVAWFGGLWAVPPPLPGGTRPGIQLDVIMLFAAIPIACLTYLLARERDQRRDGLV